MIKKIKIAIAEDHQLVRQGMIALLKEEEGLDILFDVGDGEALLDKLKTHKPDIVLMDIAMPVMDGNEALDRIREKYPKINVIIVTSHYTAKHITEFITKGAKGFLPKNCDIEKVVDAIYAVYDEGYYFDSMVSKTLVLKLINSSGAKIYPSDTVLSENERRILRLICLEKTNQEISDLVSLSKRTVEWHKNNILLKTNSKTIIGLVKYAIKNDIISEQDDADGIK